MKAVLWWFIAILATGFVFSMSLQTGEDSSQLSSGVSQTLYEIYARVNPSTNLSVDDFAPVVRKLAHITEYFVLGIFWSGVFVTMKYRIQYLFLLGFSIALVDEGIQIFVDGRGPSLFDALVFDGVSFLISSFFIQHFNLLRPKAPF